MSILDYFNGTASPEQNAGLLGFATQILGASNGRQPVNFGQALAAGTQGFNDARDGYGQKEREKKLAALQAQLLGYKVQDAESDLTNQEASRKRAADLRDFYIKRGQTAGAPAMPGAAVSANGPAPSQGGGGAGGAGGIFQERLAEAQALRSAGYGPEADAAEAAALKFQPKVKGWEKVQQGGKVLFAPFYEDGTSGQPVPLEVAEKLEKVNRGGTTDLVNPYTGTQVQSMTNTQSPDSAASVAATLRGQNMTDARAREATQQGRVPPGYRFAPDGSLAVIPGGPADPKAGKEGLQKTQDAKDVLSILDEAEPLLKKSTSSYAGAGLDAIARFGGVATQGGEAAAQLKVLQGALVSKMPKMSGPQSDKDVELYREMAGKIGDPTLPESTRLAAIKTIRKLNEQYLNNSSGAPASKPTGSGWGIRRVGE